MKLIVEQNREVNIVGIYQWPTYSGLLEGLPTRKLNKLILERIVSRAKGICYSDDTYLIEPKEESLLHVKDYAFGVPMHLPEIVCIADLNCLDPIKDKSMSGSSLVVIWFQNEYCFPIDDEILVKLTKLPWSKYSKDYDN